MNHAYRQFNLLTAILYFLLNAVPSQGAEVEKCPQKSAPDKFEYIEQTPSKSGKPVNAGIRPRGFVALKSGQPTVHGIDVSKYQDDTNFRQAYICGARFAYIRLSGGTVENNDVMYRIHWPNARSANLMTGPYHNLSLLPLIAKKWQAAEGITKKKLYSEAKEAGVISAAHQATIFLEHLDELMAIEPVPDRFTRKFSPSYLPIALDLSYDPLPSANSAEKKLFGQIVADMACSFIKTVNLNPKTKNRQIILFSSPSFYWNFRLNENRCGLELLPVWIHYFSKDGDAPYGEKRSKDIELVDYLCKPDGKPNRCIIQQYTAFGGFAVYNNNSPIDLDRFFGNQEDLNKFLISYE